MPLYTIYLLMASQVYALMYAGAAAVVISATTRAPNPLNIKRIMLEVVGATLRRQKRLLSLHRSPSWTRILRLDEDTATERDVDEAAVRWHAHMRRNWLLYPPSQHGAIARLVEHAKFRLASRDITRQAEELLRQFERALARADTRRSTWRNVLGVAPDESDVTVIKKAYRKLAQHAHPDRGGSNEAIAALNVAFGHAREELQFV